MAERAHRYDSTCRLAPVPELEPLAGTEDIPPLRAQFFYSSPMPIDDPLSAVSAGSAADGKAKRSHRPFSTGDNNALERAWLALAATDAASTHARVKAQHSSNPSLSRMDAAKLASVVDRLVARHREKHHRAGQPDPDPASISQTPSAACCSELLIDASAELRKSFCGLTRKRQPALDQEALIQVVMARLRLPEPGEPSSGPPASPPLPSQQTLANAAVKPAAQALQPPIVSRPDARGSTSLSASIPARPPATDDGLSGKPFLRVDGLEDAAATSHGSGRSTPATMAGASAASAVSAPAEVASPAAALSRAGSPVPSQSNIDVQIESSVDILVGISRLHMVSLPVLQMKPIYWSPVGDMATVLRATWFYRDTMTPVEPAVANQLEAGYRELNAYSETWQDELRCAVEVGALGEEKVSHRLWPDDRISRVRGGVAEPAEPAISSDPFCAARCFRGEAAAEGTLEPVRGQDIMEPSANVTSEARAYASYHVIYRDQSSAFLLKPSLRPSGYYGRRPVSKIMRGVTVGIPLVRGFDRAAWSKLHHDYLPAASDTADGGRELEPEDAAAEHDRDTVTDGCPACRTAAERGRVSDLVLIIHGIGQKFAERVESFHFTHAVNAFRRAVNMELASDAVRSVLREDQHGIMVLPVNWRHNLSFEEGGPIHADQKTASAVEAFALRDIEPGTIPAVRSMISDVMFDIPFYMSHHRSKMIAAVVSEANRVYRLWCRNNPEFASQGRVHLVAHSLGSAMALEVLSRQPTNPPPLDLAAAMETQLFEFDTTNLFFLGSPAGFFLLLERGRLIPRRGRLKPGADPSDAMSRGLGGDAGMFGCLAVDNIYNILAREDPIAYLLNGTIDPSYASSLRTAYAPSTSTTLLQSVGDALRGLTGSRPAPQPAQTSTAKPPTLRLPSQLEMEVHDFTREEVAEKKAYLLNDNGQIDYYLRAAGGPLEIQYLNMLSAHTSYWTNQDLIRMLCIEVGRKPGRLNTLPSMRAVKAARGALHASLKTPAE